MRFLTYTAAFAALTVLPSITLAQQVYGGPDEDRMASTVMIFGTDTMLGAASISYSQPSWKEEYDGMLDQLKGRKLRLGKNWWTTLQTATAMEIAGTKIEAGSYVLGLECDKEGAFHLLVIDAAHAMKHQMMPWAADSWKNETKIKLDLHKDKNEESTDKMEIEITAKADSTGTFAIRWGTHELGANVKYHGHPAKEASSEKKQEK